MNPSASLISVLERPIALLLNVRAALPDYKTIKHTHIPQGGTVESLFTTG